MAMGLQALLECGQAQGRAALHENRSLRRSNEKRSNVFPKPLEVEIDGGDEFGADVGRI
jgi:hypothetical protein